MTKPEEKALKKYPIEYEPSYYEDSNFFIEYDINVAQRKAYINGYEDCIKDSKLTWEDVKEIRMQSIFLEMEEAYNKKPLTEEEHYSEVLKRFKEYKEKNVWVLKKDGCFYIENDHLLLNNVNKINFFLDLFGGLKKNI